MATTTTTTTTATDASTTTDRDRELLINWLRDAHAMERSLNKTLENHANHAKEVPEIAARIERHIEEGRRHIALLENALERHGEKRSAIKDMIGSVMGGFQGSASGMFRDEWIKNALMDYAAEHFEIACYRALILAAERIGDTATAADCESILQDELEMARWLETQLPSVVNMTMVRENNR